MSDRVMVKMTVSDETVALQTFSRSGRSPHRFIILNKELDELEKKGYLIISDIHSFAKLRLSKTSGGEKTIEFTFSWLQENGSGELKGRKENVILRYEQFQKCLEQGKGKDGISQKLLSMDNKANPPIEFHSYQNLHTVVQKKKIRRKLGKFLAANFAWTDAKKIVVFDDFCPYSFCFNEITDRGTGICGGIILHEQDEPKKMYYSLHT